MDTVVVYAKNVAVRMCIRDCTCDECDDEDCVYCGTVRVGDCNRAVCDNDPVFDCESCRWHSELIKELINKP